MALVYIVEDDESIREIEKIALENSGHTVVDFYNASSFLKKTKDKVPDLAILDIMLPDMDGYEIVRRLKNGKNTKKIPVIMVTARTTEVDMIRGLDIGADDYIKKPFSVIELITRVKAVLRRTMDKDEATMISVGEVFMDNERHTVYVNNEPAVLTYKEYELLKLLMVNSGIVMTRDVIMDRVWGLNLKVNRVLLICILKRLGISLGNQEAELRR